MFTSVRKNYGGDKKAKTLEEKFELFEKRCDIKKWFCLALIIAIVLVVFAGGTIGEVTEVYSEMGYLG